MNRVFTEDLRENILASRDCSSADQHIEIINDNNTRITFRMTGLEPKVNLTVTAESRKLTILLKEVVLVTSRFFKTFS